MSAAEEDELPWYVQAAIVAAILVILFVIGIDLLKIAAVF